MTEVSSMLWRYLLDCGIPTTTKYLQALQFSCLEWLGAWGLLRSVDNGQYDGGDGERDKHAHIN